MAHLIWLFCVLSLSACVSTSSVPGAERLFHDGLFSTPVARIDPGAVFALSPEMRSYMDQEISAKLRPREKREALIEALYRRGTLKLEYDSEFTRNASEAFAARSGNCLSLVIMTAAFAKELGLAVRFQRYSNDPMLGRTATFDLSIDHVNLTLDTRHPDLHQNGTSIDRMTVDFLPPEDLSGLRMQTVSEAGIVAMYMNNRAAESLARGRLDDAYWWARAAIIADGSFTSALNTLGVIYRQHGNLAEAERVFLAALDQEPANTHVMHNLAVVLSAQGRETEAAGLRNRIARIDPEPAFTYFDRGRAAMEAGNYGVARELFEREVGRAPYYHEFHFWLALALFRLGDLSAAEQQLSLAEQNSTMVKDRVRYAAKLEHLRRLPVR